MRKVTERLLQLYVFTIPWESVANVPGLGAFARLSGIALAGAAVLTIAAEGRFRKPDTILGLALAFVAMSALSLLWTISVSGSLQPIVTYAQLLISLWVVREVARTTQQQRQLLVAFLLGLFVPVVVFFTRFALFGARDVSLKVGIAGFAITPQLVIGIPIAWHLATTSAGALRAIAFAYIPMALVIEPITGGRTDFIAGIAALAVMTLTAGYSRRRIFLVVSLLVALPLVVTQVIPPSSQARLSGLPEELAHGNLNYRRGIWSAGLRAFPEHPVLGTGVGTYGAATAPFQPTFFGDILVAHNVFVGILVEQGILGLALFVALLIACGQTILRLPPGHRRLWAAIMLCWLIQAQAGSSERTKMTWMLFALLAAQHTIGSARGRALPAAPKGTDTMAWRGRPSWVPTTGGAASSRMAGR